MIIEEAEALRAALTDFSSAPQPGCLQGLDREAWSNDAAPEAEGRGWLLAITQHQAVLTYINAYDHLLIVGRALAIDISGYHRCMVWTFIKYDTDDDDSAYLGWLASHPGDFVIISERTPRAAHVILHRATCSSIGAEATHDEALGHSYVRVCGPHDLLEEQFRYSEVRLCQICL
jgi:hypothetical protein